MKRLLSQPWFALHMHQGAKFIMSGLGGATIEFTVVTVLVELLKLDPRIAYLPSGLLAVTFVFFFNKYVTFRNRDRDIGRQTMRFLMVYGMAFTLNYLLASTLYSLGVQYLLAKAMAIGAIASLNYCLSHGFIFRRQPELELPL